MSSKLPKVAIVGLSNVGKSTLFNRLTGKSEAIVSQIPGATVDRNEAVVYWDGVSFLLIDMAGVGKVDAPIQQQTDQAIKEADLILLLVTKDSPQLEVRKKLKDKRFVVAVNKIDTIDKNSDYGLAIPISASHGKNINTLLDKIIGKLPNSLNSQIELDQEITQIAIIGRPNVGKSTLLNKLLGYERSVVSETPGTTRDRIKAAWGNVILVDTAGVRRPARVKKGLEQQAVSRALRSIAEAQIILIVLDASEGVTQQDLKLVRAVSNQRKKAILVFNKSDIGFANYGRFSFLKKFPTIAISAKNGTNVEALIKMVESVVRND